DATVPLAVNTRDTHSLVRIQSEILATNRLRAVGFAVAISPVRREFFTVGPGGDCVILCMVTGVALLRLSGEDKTSVQLGVGFAFHPGVKPLQINAGLLFGTADGSSAWRWDRTWFLGIAIDPILLSDAINTAESTKHK